MRRIAFAAVFFAALATLPWRADAASLRVAPLSLERVSPAVSGALRLTNTGILPIRVQIRIFRWRQANGIETLTPTQDVVVSPPAAVLQPGIDHTVRVVRLAKTPIQGEESYRLLVDELPTPDRRRRKTVNLVLRYSIPVFFAPSDAGSPDIVWNVRYRNGRFELTAANNGARRMKVARLDIRDAKGTTYRVAEGLVGYVLAGSTMRWSLPASPKRMPQPGKARLRFVSDEGVTDVAVGLKAGGG